MCYNTNTYYLQKRKNSMLIDDELLNKLEKLSALKIPENKRSQMKSQLEKIIRVFTFATTKTR